MAFGKYSESLTRAFATLDKDLKQNKMTRKNLELLINGIKMADIKLISCKAIISQNYAIDFTGTCSHFSYQVTRFHGGAQLETQT